MTLLTGIRLYFVVSTLSIKQSKCRPDGLYLVHVRLPPGFTSSSVQRPASVHAANYQNGLLFEYFILNKSCSFFRYSLRAPVFGLV